MSRPFTVAYVFNNDVRLYGQFATRIAAERAAAPLREAIALEADDGNAIDAWVCRIGYANDAPDVIA